MRLWYRPESDGLFMSEEEANDALCDDVTMEPRFRQAAKDRGYDISQLPPLHKLDVTHGYVAPEVTSGKHTMAAAIVASYKRWERKPADLYPTPVNAVEAIMEVIKVLGIKKVWEPACGDGRIARVLEWHGIEVHGTDFREHTGYGHGGLDFINDDPAEKWGWDVEGMGFDAIITNPPFSLAREFIEKSLKIAPAVIMLVKQNYYNTDNRFDFFGEHRPAMFLPLTWRLAFLPERGKSPLMDCAWAIWIRDGEKLYDADGRQVDACLMEPVRKKVYPGYHGPGLRSVLAGLTEAFDDLGRTLRGLL